MKFNNEKKTLMLLNFLPTSPIYKNLVTTLMQVEKTLILEEIISALLSFNMWKKASDENSQGKWLAVRSNKEREINKSGMNREIIKLSLNRRKGRTHDVISVEK